MKWIKRGFFAAIPIVFFVYLSSLYQRRAEMREEMRSTKRLQSQLRTADGVRVCTEDHSQTVFILKGKAARALIEALMVRTGGGSATRNDGLNADGLYTLEFWAASTLLTSHQIVFDASDRRFRWRWEEGDSMLYQQSVDTLEKLFTSHGQRLLRAEWFDPESAY